MARKKPAKPFDEKISVEIVELAKNGKTNKQISEYLGLAVNTIDKWTTSKESLIKAIKEARGPTDDTVEATLLQKALGYHKECIKIFYDPKLGEVIEHKYMEFVAPDLGAQCMWLKNRRPNQWRESKSILLENVNETQKVQILSDLGKNITEALKKWTED